MSAFTSGGQAGVGNTKTKTAYSSAFTQSITSDAYGQSIPLSRGDRTIEGQLLWATSVRQETKTTTSGYSDEGGGSFGPIATYNSPVEEFVPPDPVTTIETTGMFVDCMIGFGAPLNGDVVPKLLQLIVGSNITYDDTGDTLTTPVSESITFYNGSEDQLPDPLMESYLGKNNVPGYRGEIYVVIKKLDLLQYGGVFPLFKARIADQSSTSNPVATIGGDVEGNTLGLDYIRGLSYWVSGLDTYRMVDANRDVEITEISVAGATLLGGLQGSIASIPWLDFLIANLDGGNTSTIACIQASTGAIISQFGVSGSGTDMGPISFSSLNWIIPQIVQAGANAVPVVYVVCGSFLGGAGVLAVNVNGDLSYAGHNNFFPGDMKTGCRGPVFANQSLVFTSYQTKIYQFVLDASASSAVPDILGELPLNYTEGTAGDKFWFELGSPYTEIESLHWSDKDQLLYAFVQASGGDRLLGIDLAGQIRVNWPIPTTGQSNFVRPQSRISGDIIGWNGGGTHYTINVKSGAVTTFATGANLEENYWDGYQQAFIGEDVTTSLLTILGGGLITGGRIALSTLLTELSDYVGFDTAFVQVDAAIANLVDGFLLTEGSGTDFYTLTSTWGAAFLFDVVETGDSIAFKVKVQITPDLEYDFELDYTDLATLQQTDFPRNTGDPFSNAAIVTTQQSPSDVVDNVAMTYFDYDYQDTVTVNRARARLPGDLTPRGQTLQITIPELIFRNDEATSLIAQILFNEITASITHQCRLGTAFADVIPGDLIQLIVGQYEYAMRVTSVTYHADFSTSVEASDFMSDVSLIERTGQLPVSPPVLVAEDDRSQVTVMDMPIIQASDDMGNVAVGVYYGLSGFGQENWRQADLFRSVTGGLYDFIERDTHELFVGRMMTALGAPADVWAYDEDNTFTFFLDVGDPDRISSVDDDAWLGLSIMVAIGAPGRWEMVSIRDIELEPGETRIFNCGQLLRGLRDTYMHAGSHIAGDRIVFLKINNGLQQTVENQDSIAQTVFYKGIGANQDALTAPHVSISLAGEAQRPMSTVAHLAVLDSGDDDVTLSWARQSRLSSPLRGIGVERDVNEFTDELYILRVYDGVTLVRTENLADVQEWLYSVADQATDGFTSPMSYVTFSVTQITDDPGVPDGREVINQIVVDRS